MTQKLCPYCGTSSPPESLFCRACGASLRHVGTDDLIASPLDKTIPLAPNVRQTNDTPSESESAWRSLVEFNGDSLDPEATITTPRPSSPIVAPASALAPPSAAPMRESGAGETRSKNWRWWLVASTCVAALAAVVTLAALNAANPTPPAAEQPAATGVPLPDESAVSQWMTDEAERLFAAGQTAEAIERLREAARLDDRNARAQLQLGAALERTGKRGEALVFYAAATALAPDDREAWRRLAEAQFADNRFPEAAQSYRRFFQASGQNLNASTSPEDDALRLRLADALRATGEEQAARTLYSQLTRSAQASVRQAAQAQLAALQTDGQLAAEQTAQQATNAAPSERANGAARDAIAHSPVASSSVPPPVAPKPSPIVNSPSAANLRISPQERFERAVRLYSTDRQTALAEFRSVADTIPDARYFIGLARTEGRSPRNMHRAELLAALADFQTAGARGSRYAAQANRLAEQLGREYDRRRKNDER